MKLEQQVVSLDQAKRLKELGVKQESLFAWQSRDDKWQIVDAGLISHGWQTSPSAFTVAELGEMLPAKLDDKRLRLWFTPKSRITTEKNFCIGYEDMNKVVADTEADARAKMLIYLIENGLYKELLSK